MPPSTQPRTSYCWLIRVLTLNMATSTEPDQADAAEAEVGLPVPGGGEAARRTAAAQVRRLQEAGAAHDAVVVQVPRRRPARIDPERHLLTVIRFRVTIQAPFADVVAQVVQQKAVGHAQGHADR